MGTIQFESLEDRLQFSVTAVFLPAGGGVLPPDWRAILLLGAGVLPASLVVSWRSARRRGQQARRVTSPG